MENEYQLTHGTEENNADLSHLSFDDEDEIYDSPEFQATEPEEEEIGQYYEEESTEEPSLIARLLRDKGIQDPSKIKFADDDDNLQDVDWNDLSLEEQYNILSSQPSEETPSPEDFLTEDEINFLNVLRQNNLTPEQYLQAVVQEQLANQEPPEPVYEIDSLTDDELFIGDLQIRTPDITDEELLDALNKAKENPELFNKQVNGLRKEYKALEDQNREEQQLLAQEQNQAQYQEFQESIYEGIDSINSFGEIDIELSDDDKNEIADFILTPNQNTGISKLQESLADPKTLSQIAWFLLKGQDTIDGLIQYFTKEISKVRETYQGKGQKPAPKVVITKPQQKSQSRKVSSIDDLD